MNRGKEVRRKYTSKQKNIIDAVRKAKDHIKRTHGLNEARTMYDSYHFDTNPKTLVRQVTEVKKQIAEMKLTNEGI